MRNERFPTHRWSKLHPRGDELFQVFEKINDNAYKLDLPGEYNVFATFNVADISSFDAGDDSKLNLFEERGDDASYGPASQDSLHIHRPKSTPKVQQARYQSIK
ncbi:Uncharacterized protein Adt_39981 [Abeliophyllum distichum]|uniref:Tf2-1-like SH3-like domain-containing protein n=1 Tax=Abeliophyllum distichum TaxID=126358 RepID=A0ABD1Q6P0_9LAMI